MITYHDIFIKNDIIITRENIKMLIAIFYNNLLLFVPLRRGGTREKEKSMKFSIEYGVCRVDDSQVHIVPNKPDTVEADNLDAVIAILAAAKLPQLIGGLTIKELHIKTVVDNNITP